MIRKATFLIISIYLLVICVSAAKASAPDDTTPKKGFIALAPLTVVNADRVKTPEKTVVFRHGDISWLPELAFAAGWKPAQLKRLGNIILRESGGCPNRIGGSIVDANCNITGHTGATNRSDSGLLQINGVNWDISRNKYAIACVKFGFCSQEQLLDPLNNLMVGRALFEVAGWQPWNACNWDPSRC